VRILDAGAHDGFLTTLIRREHPDAHIDALELNEDAAKACGARINGRCLVGAAEDAPHLFEPGSYDVVFAGELIEHVQAVGALLDALEAMVNPGGRVILSTPDGTFAQGGNPHHLRTYRAVDLADLLRRRGVLIDMESSEDGIATAAYEPGPRGLDVAIYCGPGWEPWHPADIEQRGLGGSETAAVRLAEELSELGHVVTVYGEMREGAVWRNVIFRRHEAFDPLDERDAVICSRLPEVADRPIRAAVKLLWLHDVDVGPRLTPERAAGFDRILCLSEWHARHVAGRYPFAADRIETTRNGVHLAYFDPLPWEQRAPRVLFTSSPDRGLDVLLGLWPRVLDRVPAAELAHCYSAVYDKIADQDPVVGEHRKRIRSLSSQPGVACLGSLGQRELATLMCSSRVWAHPSWMGAHGAPFHETSCIGAMEAQAAGCVVVASDWGALPETVYYGTLIESGPPPLLDKGWEDSFVESIVLGLVSPVVGEQAVSFGPQAAARMGWSGVAEQVAALIAR
jgi:glycosyltransferase involved in cell wall biosynthesis